MVKIIHMADTHLGYRVRRGAAHKWAIENYSKPFEQEIYDTFLKVMTDVSLMKDIDFVVHCGDMFHQPSIFSSYPPPEPARMALIQGLQKFFANTNNQVPLIYIEGNHGVFRGYEYTPFESHINKENYPNLYYFKEKDLLDAINSKNPLSLEFPDKMVRFHLFPFFEYNSFEGYKNAYDNWITLQKPKKDDDYINIAVAHGASGGDIPETLHNKISSDDYGYNYVALGHEHGFRKVMRNHYYSGSLLPMNFKERYESQGYLIVNINGITKELTVERSSTDILLKRPFEIVEIEVPPKQSSADLENNIYNKLKNRIIGEEFEPKTSARLKFTFKGEMTIEKNWQINELMSRIRREIFSQPDKFNVLQLIWKIADISETIEDEIRAGLIQNYILEKPDEEFKAFVEEKLSEDKTNYDLDKLTDFGMKAIKKALKIMEREKEV